MMVVSILDAFSTLIGWYQLSDTIQVLFDCEYSNNIEKEINIMKQKIK